MARESIVALVSRARVILWAMAHCATYPPSTVNTLPVGPSPRALPACGFGSLASMMQAAVEGLGVAILQLFAAERHTALVGLRAVLDQPHMKLWVLSHKEVRSNARVKALSRHLTREIPRVLSARQRAAN